jgi:hypothetical protein
MNFITLHLPQEYADNLLTALAYLRESWERTGRAWEDGEQDDLAELEYCGSAEDAWVAVRFIREIEKEVKQQMEPKLKV